MKVKGYQIKVYYHKSGTIDSNNKTWHYCDEVKLPELRDLGFQWTLRWRDGYAPFSDSLRGLNESIRKEVESHLESLGL